VAGHTGDHDTARVLAGHRDGGVRSTAVGALARCGHLGESAARAALADPDTRVRRRALEAIAAVGADTEHPLSAVPIQTLLEDADPSVAETAAWAIGERVLREPGDVEVLSRAAMSHGNALVREAAVAALGAVGDVSGLPAILAATTDKPAVRRRAVLALAPFEGPEVDNALARARDDRDWQVRQAAEDLGGPADP
jgi:HEAT repeat protein